MAALATALVALVAALVQLRRMSRLRARLEGLTRGEEGRSLEAILDAHIDKVFEVARQLDEVAERSEALERTGRRAFQRIGIVRFNPFEDTGGNQSFALALLDGNDDGIVISSLHARAGTRVYAKTLTAGKADSSLSAEETEALRRAMAEPARTARRAV